MEDRFTTGGIFAQLRNIREEQLKEMRAKAQACRDFPKGVRVDPRMAAFLEEQHQFNKKIMESTGRPEDWANMMMGRVPTHAPFGPSFVPFWAREESEPEALKINIKPKHITLNFKN